MAVCSLEVAGTVWFVILMSASLGRLAVFVRSGFSKDCSVSGINGHRGRAEDPRAAGSADPRSRRLFRYPDGLVLDSEQMTEDGDHFGTLAR
jgi:hypothetical protein